MCLCIFPFEPELLASIGIAATYVGIRWPNVIPMPDRAGAPCAALGLAPDDEVLAVLPGSRRRGAITRQVFRLQRWSSQARPAIKFIVPAVPLFRARIEQLVRSAGWRTVRVVTGQSHTVLAACDVTLIASGTATLEAALFKAPHGDWLPHAPL